MRRLLLSCSSVVFAGVFAGVACQSTGILVEVTRDGSLDSIQALRISVASALPPPASGPTTFVDLEPLDEVDVSSRDLLDDPYRLLLRRGDRFDDSVLVVAWALRDGRAVGFGQLPEMVGFRSGQVLKWELVVSASDGATADCAVIDVAGEPVRLGAPDDRDCDGVLAAQDCDDTDPRAHPGAAEFCGDGIDNNCNDLIDEDVDEDLDGVTTCGGDCNDANDQINPAAVDVCDGLDNNCDGFCDEVDDQDGDRVTTCGTLRSDDGTRCVGTLPEGDCDDTNDKSSPRLAEECDGIDNDCNGLCDDVAELDPDNDGYTDCGSYVGFCGLNVHDVDCAAGSADQHPSHQELCSTTNESCDGRGLERERCFVAEGLECMAGIRTCGNDGVPDACVQSVVVPDTIVVPEATCTIYEKCLAEAGKDPLSCLSERLRETLGFVCDVPYAHGTRQMCPNLGVALSHEGTVGCLAAVIGGDAHADAMEWVARLQELGGNQVAVSTECDPSLVVSPKTDPPRFERLFVQLGDEDNALQAVSIELNPVRVDTCPAAARLTCTPVAAP